MEGPVLFLSSLFSMIQQHFLSGIAVGGLVDDLLTKFQNVLVGDFHLQVFGESLCGSLEIALVGFEDFGLGREKKFVSTRGRERKKEREREKERKREKEIERIERENREREMLVQLINSASDRER